MHVCLSILRLYQICAANVLLIDSSWERSWWLFSLEFGCFFSIQFCKLIQLNGPRSYFTGSSYTVAQTCPSVDTHKCDSELSNVVTFIWPIDLYLVIFGHIFSRPY